MAVGANATEGRALFAGQDAFSRLQITVHGQRRPELNEHLGEGVLVAVFDTCPPAEALSASPAVPLAWLHTHMAASAMPSGDFADHGLMVASLINFVAPRAEIHLYQVLDGKALGDSALLIKALADFLDSAGARPAVINLSLGSMCECGTSLAAVEALLWEATNRGMVVCAAAGNFGRHGKKPSTIPHAQMPAALPYVIAVAASNQADVRASYSHRGDIAAPGGETLGVPTPDGFDSMIGVGTASTASGYVRMDCGTSFAAPLVSGAGALVLEDLVKRGASLDSGTWRRVLLQLAEGAMQPNGQPDSLNTSGLGAGIVRLYERKVFRGF